MNNDEMGEILNEFNSNDFVDNIGLDSVGYENTGEELESNEIEKGNDGEESFIDDGSGDDGSLSIDYVKLTESVRDAQTVNTIDTELNDLPLSDVLMLIIALVLGVILVRRKA